MMPQQVEVSSGVHIQSESSRFFLLPYFFVNKPQTATLIQPTHEEIQVKIIVLQARIEPATSAFL
jgi:hypothetical protein